MADIRRGLDGLLIVDLGYGLAAAQAAKLLAGMGADVRRFEPVGGDPFRSHYPAYDAWRRGAQTTQVAALDDPAVTGLLGEADVCILGGEEFPGHSWRPDVERLRAEHPRLIVLAFETDALGSEGPAVEILAQARSGLAFEQSRSRPVASAFAPASYCAALHGLTATLGALCARERGAGGALVQASLHEGALTLGSQFWMRADTPDGSFAFEIPKDPHPLVFRCRDGRYVHLVLGSLGSKGSLYRILQIDDPTVKPEDAGFPNPRGGAKNFFGDVDVLAAHVARIDSEDLLAQTRAAGVVAEHVLDPGGCWGDPQVEHLGVVESDGRAARHVGLPLRGALHEAGAPWRPAPGPLPLSGVRVLDFGMFVAGPYAGPALADLGADVIKVDTPQGDPNRALYRSHAAVNRGKRSVVLDLKTAEGRAAAERLIAGAHVVLNNFRPGASARLGVDPATLHAGDPDKIVLEVTGYGRTGPSGSRPGFDMIFQALCGHEVRAGGVAGAPAWDRTTMVDYLVGLLGQVAILVALLRRLQGRGGADLEVSLLEAGLFAMSELVEDAQGVRSGAPPLNAARTGFHPAEAFHPCADGWIAVAARGDAMAAALASVLGFQAPPRAAWGDREGAAIDAALAGRTVEEALRLLGEAGVWAERVEPSGERALFEGDDPGQVLTTPHPGYGEVRQLGALFRLDGRRHTHPRGAPGPGEHTREVLAELGYDADEIDRLFAGRAVA